MVHFTPRTEYNMSKHGALGYPIHYGFTSPVLAGRMFKTTINANIGTGDEKFSTLSKLLGKTYCKQEEK